MHRVRRHLCLSVLLVVFVIGAAVGGVAVGGVAAAAAALTPPPDRVVLPGEFVTLVFRVVSDSATAAELSVRSTPELELVGGVGTVELEAGKPARAAVTVRVPDDLAAFTLVDVRLELRSTAGDAAASVQLTVGERRGVTLTAPSEVTLGADGVTSADGMRGAGAQAASDGPAGEGEAEAGGTDAGASEGQGSKPSATFDATVANVGNVLVRARLVATQDDAVLVDRELSLVPGASSAVPITVARVGTVRVRLRSLGTERDGAGEGDEDATAEERAAAQDARQGGPLQEATVRVVHEGVPPPPELRLQGEVALRLSSDLALEGSLDLAGALSDYLDVDAHIESPTATESSVGLTGEGWSARFFDLGTAPYGLRLPPGFGVRASRDVGPFEFGAAAALTGSGTAGGYLLVGDPARGRRWGVAAGVDAGAPLVVAHLDRRDRDGRLDADGRYAAGDLGFAVTSVQTDHTHQGELAWTVAGRRLLDADGSFSVATSYADADLSLYGRVEVPFGDGATWRPSASASLRLPTRLPGRLYLQGSADTRARRIGVTYTAALLGGWQLSNRVAASGGDAGTGLEFGSSWNYLAGPGNGFGTDLSLSYLPATDRLDGEARVRYDLTLDTFRAELHGGWHVGDGSVGLGATAEDTFGPLTLAFDGSVGYDAGTPVSVAVGIEATYAFELPTPPAVTRATGGRRLGVLKGRVAPASGLGAGATTGVNGVRGVPGIVLRIDGATVRADEDGRFEVEVAPGTHRVTLDPGSVPIAYRLEGSASQEVSVEAKGSVTVDFRLVAAAGVRGRLIVDSDGDGVPDVPAAPAQGAVRLTASDGSSQVLEPDADGAFVARGLPPGLTRLELGGLAIGTTVVGDAQIERDLRAGEVADVRFLVQPVVAVAPSFDAARLRVRDVAFEVDRAPPGSAPLVRVTVSEEADSVSVHVGDVEVTLRPAPAAVHGWTGRVPVPDDAPDGLLDVLVTATRGSGSAERDADLRVDASSQLVRPEPVAAVRAGGVAELALVVLDAAKAVTFTPRFGGGVSDEVLGTERGPGRWTAELPVPAGTPDGIYEIAASIQRADGTLVPVVLRLRVLGP